MYQVSLMPSLRMPPAARNGLVNKVDFWGPLLKVIKTNEIVRSLIIVCGSFHTTAKSFISVWVSVPFLCGFGVKCF